MSEDIPNLLRRMDRLERAVKQLVQRMNALESDGGSEARHKSETEGGSPLVDGEVLAQVVELENRLRQIEEENRQLSALCQKLQEDNEAISNLYVAKHRLHASLDAKEILHIITEILVELVGAEAFTIFFIDRSKTLLKRVVSRGSDPRASDTVTIGEGLLGRVASEGRPFYAESKEGQKPRPDEPVAVIALSSDGYPLGLIAIYRLLVHKQGLTPVDHQLLELVAEHAPRALLSAHLHGKRKT